MFDFTNHDIIGNLVVHCDGINSNTKEHKTKHYDNNRKLIAY